MDLEKFPTRNSKPISPSASSKLTIIQEVTPNRKFSADAQSAA